MSIYGAIEAGGTKFVCGVASAPDAVLEQATISTREPAATIAECIRFFRSAFSRHGTPTAVGIGSFGALDPAPHSDWYGHIRETPKTGWTNADMAGEFGREFGVPVRFDTDVNAAALAEHRFGAGRTSGIRAAGHTQSTGEDRETDPQGVNSLVYITVGTGIGGGAVSDGRIVHGFLHPEMGHIPVSRELDDTEFGGVCPYHGDCLEGLASGPALQARWGVPATDLPADHKAWTIEAGYLGSLAVTLTGILSPEVIVCGGGVMHVPGLIELVRREAWCRMNGYFPPAWNKETDSNTYTAHAASVMREYIVQPVLGDSAGLTGAVTLAMEAITPESEAR